MSRSISIESVGEGGSSKVVVAVPAAHRVKKVPDVQRLQYDDERSLRWYWNEAEGELGLRSHSFEPLTPTSDTADWRAIEAAHHAIHAVERWRTIDERLSSLHVEHRQALCAYYGRPTPIRCKQCRDWSGPCVPCRSPVRQHEQTLLRVLPLVGGFDGRRGVEKQRKKVWDEAEALLSAACAAFAGRDRAA